MVLQVWWGAKHPFFCTYTMGNRNIPLQSFRNQNRVNRK
ncbi:hypothetical protein FLA_5703 [Filimonas lacunae]|nr:hypothetical protein FLA_5703 [Filimonas lacunae]